MSKKIHSIPPLYLIELNYQTCLECTGDKSLREKIIENVARKRGVNPQSTSTLAMWQMRESSIKCK